MRFFALFLCLVPLTGQAETFIVPSKVTDVTLYPYSAKITRKAAFSIPAGTHHIVLNNIPVDQEALVTARASATGAAIGNIIYRENFISNNRQSDSEEIQTAKENIKEIEQKIEVVKTRLSRPDWRRSQRKHELDFWINWDLIKELCHWTLIMSAHCHR